MGFNSSDTETLNLAKKYWLIDSMDVADGQESMAKISIGNLAPETGAAELLSKTLTALALFYNSPASTVWLDVTVVDIPAYVSEAIERCAGFGMGLVVTHYDHCSHAPGKVLPDSIRSVVIRAQRDGMLWHPVAQEMVYSHLS